MRLLLAAIALASAAMDTVPARATIEEVPPSPSLYWMQGEWTGSGTLQGFPAQVTLRITPVLKDTATDLYYTAVIAPSPAQPGFRYEARGTYRVQSGGRVLGQWIDTRGNLHPLIGKVSAGLLQVNWGDVRTELGHSSYVLGADGTLTVTDSVYANGTTREFARASYRRKP